MNERRRVLLLILIMASVASVVGGTSFLLLYRTALAEEKVRLVETAQSQARLIEAVARFDASNSMDYPKGAVEATLSQIRDAHDHYTGFGKSGEFTLAQRKGDYMVFLLRHRHYDLDLPKPVPFDSDLAEPMRRSLSRQSGTMIGLDYRGVEVLAAYEPVDELNWGIVAKIDMEEIRMPFLRSGMIAAICGLSIVSLGAALFLKATAPLLRQLEESEERFRHMFEQAADAVVLIDAHTRSVVEFNDHACQNLGYTRDEFQHLRLEDLEATESEEEIEKRINRLKQEGRDSFETQHKAKSGMIHDILVKVSSISLGGKTYCLGIWHDITEQKKIEKALRESKERLSRFMDSATDGFILFDSDLNYVDINKAALRMVHLERSDFAGKNILDIVPDIKETGRFSRYKKVVETGRNLVLSDVQPHPTFGLVYVDIKVFKVADGLGMIFTDTTERKKAEEALKESREVLRRAIEGTRFAVWDWNAVDNRTAWSENAEEILGFPKGSFGKDYESYMKWVHPDDVVPIRNRVTKAVKDQVDYFSEYRVIRPNGEVRWLTAPGKIFRDATGMVIRIAGTMMDITKRKQTEDELRSLHESLEEQVKERTQELQTALSEKGVLLREVHHRVKNNLQIISSLMDMISMRTDNQETVNTCSDARTRIHTMSLIHAQLYQTSDFERIDLRHYIQEMTAYLTGLYSKGNQIHFIVDCTDIYLTMIQAVPCALALNEIFTNTLKHAFEEEQRGSVLISCSTQNEGKLMIKVKDDGIGIAEGTNISKIQTLGLKLVYALIHDQLKGTFHLKRTQGTVAIIEFPKE